MSLVIRLPAESILPYRLPLSLDGHVDKYFDVTTLVLPIGVIINSLERNLLISFTPRMHRTNDSQHMAALNPF